MKLLLYSGIYLIVALLTVYIGRNSLGNSFLPIFLAFNSAFVIGLLFYAKKKAGKSS